MHPQRNDILAELTEMGSPLARLPRRMPFLVPADYFGQETVEELVRLSSGAWFDAEIAIPGLSSGMPFRVPAGYFEALPEETLLAAHESELKAIPRPRFALPGGYFESLPDTILAAAKASDTTGVKAVPLPAAMPSRTRRIALPVMRLAAAAALILAVGFGLYQAGNPSNAPVITKRALAAVPKQVLQDYMDQHIDEFDADMLAQGVAAEEGPKLRASEIEAYLSDDSPTL